VIRKSSSEKLRPLHHENVGCTAPVFAEIPLPIIMDCQNYIEPALHVHRVIS
jgi:hypothetical protein